MIFCKQGKLAMLLPELGGEMSFVDSLPSGVPRRLVHMGIEKGIRLPQEGHL